MKRFLVTFGAVFACLTMVLAPFTQAQAAQVRWIDEKEFCNTDSSQLFAFQPANINLEYTGKPDTNVSITLTKLEFIFRVFSNKFLLDGQSIEDVRSIMIPDIESDTLNSSTGSDPDPNTSIGLIRQFQNGAKIKEDGVVGYQTDNAIGFYEGLIYAELCLDGSSGDLTPTDSQLYILRDGRYVPYNGSTVEDGAYTLYRRIDGNYVDSGFRAPADAIGQADGGLTLIPDNPGVLSWSTVGGGRKGFAVIKGVGLKFLSFVDASIAVIILICVTGVIGLFIVNRFEDAIKWARNLVIACLGLGLRTVFVMIFFPIQGDVYDIDNSGRLDVAMVFNTNGVFNETAVSFINFLLGIGVTVGMLGLVGIGIGLIIAGSNETAATNLKKWGRNIAIGAFALTAAIPAFTALINGTVGIFT